MNDTKAPSIRNRHLRGLKIAIALLSFAGILFGVAQSGILNKRPTVTPIADTHVNSTDPQSRVAFGELPDSLDPPDIEKAGSNEYVLIDTALHRMKLSEYNKAKPLAERALQICRSKSPLDKLAQSCALAAIGTCDQAEGRRLEALAELTPAYSFLKTTSPTNPRAITALAEVVRGLAGAHAALDHTKLAERFFREGIETSEQAYGRQSLHHLMALNRMGTFYVLYGHLSAGAATAMSAKYFKAADALSGRDPVSELNAYFERGTAYSARGLYALAQPAFEHALAARQKLGPREKFSLIYIMLPLSIAYDHLGEHKKAEGILDDALEVSRRADPGCIGDVLINLGNHYFKLGAGQHLSLHLKAAEYYKQAFNSYSKSGNRLLSFTQRVMGRNYYAAAMCGMPDGYSKAKASFKAALDLTPPTATSVQDQMQRLMLYEMIGELCVYSHEYGEAETALKHVSEIEMDLHRKTGTPLGVNTSLADIYFRQGKYSEALDIYLRGVSLFKKESQPTDYLEVLCRTGDCLVHLGKPAEAESYYLKAHQISPNYPDHRMSLATHRQTIISDFLHTE